MLLCLCINILQDTNWGIMQTGIPISAIICMLLNVHVVLCQENSPIFFIDMGEYIFVALQNITIKILETKSACTNH